MAVIETYVFVGCAVFVFGGIAYCMWSAARDDREIEEILRRDPSRGTLTTGDGGEPSPLK